MVRAVYARRPGWDEGRIALRTDQVLASPARLNDDVIGWLKNSFTGRFLDLGCGAGMLLAAAARLPGQGIGIDVSMTWLVVAKRLILEHGGVPVLAAALGEALPLADGILDAVVSLDVIEHVRDPDAYLREIDRVTSGGGTIALSMPNRYSLTSEPHVFVWGVGWLPTRYQAAFVRWRSGKIYDDTRLMSSYELRRRLAKSTKFDVRVVIPPVPPFELARFTRVKALLATAYNRSRNLSAVRWILLLIAPFFHVVGVRR